MSVVGTYFLYYSIVFFTSMLAYFSEFLRKNEARKLGKFIFWIAVLFPALIAGFRFGIGTDYFSYESIYTRLTTSYLNLFELISYTRYEPGWIALNLFTDFVFGEPKFLFVLSATLTWVIFFKAIYNQKNYVSISLAILILLCTMYNISFNLVRQTLAMAFLLLSISPLLEKKFWRYIITVLMASMFHFTALIFLPAYWIVNSRNEKVAFFKKAMAPIFFILLIVFIDPILNLVTSFDAFAAYSTYDLQSGSFGFGNIIMRLPIFIVIWINYKKLKMKENPIHRIVVLYFIGVILIHLGYLAPHVNRIAGYYEITQVLILGALVRVQNNKYEKFMYSYGIIIYYVAWFTYNFLVLGKNETIPYQWIP